MLFPVISATKVLSTNDVMVVIVGGIGATLTGRSMLRTQLSRRSADVVSIDQRIEGQ